APDEGTQPPTAPVAPDPVPASESRPGRVRVIGLTGGGGAPAMLIQPAATAEGETPEQFRERTGNAGRGGLGRERSIGEHDEHGRVLVGQSTATLPARSALDAYAPQAEREL